MTGASILVSVGVLVGSDAIVASEAVVAVVVVHNLCVHSLQMHISSGSLFH